MIVASVLATVEMVVTAVTVSLIVPLKVVKLSMSVPAATVLSIRRIKETVLVCAGSRAPKSQVISPPAPTAPKAALESAETKVVPGGRGF